MLFTDDNKLKCVKRELTEEVIVMEVKLKKTEPKLVAAITHVGIYAEVSKLYQEIINWLRQKRLKITGPPFGWFYDNPQKSQATNCEAK